MGEKNKIKLGIEEKGNENSNKKPDHQRQRTYAYALY